MYLEQIALPWGGILTAYLHEESPQAPYAITRHRPAVIICPGGGYEHLAFREKDPPAMAFLNMGFQVFTLEYALNDSAKSKHPLIQLAWSIKLVRERHESWHLNPEHVFVMGFSAGGHLAASLGVHWDDRELAEHCGAEDSLLLRPDGLILCYPVITTNEFTHEGTRKRVTAGNTEPETYWSLETQVTSKTPPVFIWHTVNDLVVPVQNTLLFVDALTKMGIPFESHLFPDGPHGMSVCTEEVGTFSKEVGMWIGLCRNWIQSQFCPLGGI